MAHRTHQLRTTTVLCFRSDTKAVKAGDIGTADIFTRLAQFHQR